MKCFKFQHQNSFHIPGMAFPGQPHWKNFLIFSIQNHPENNFSFLTGLILSFTASAQELYKIFNGIKGKLHATDIG
jgi:hypothetical protein